MIKKIFNLIPKLRLLIKTKMVAAGYLDLGHCCAKSFGLPKLLLWSYSMT